MASPDELDWDDLRYFLRAAQASTLAGAARALGVEHTTVGRRLASLERSLGTALVLRGPDGLHLTRVGEQILPHVEALEHAVAAIRERAASQGSRVRLAVPSGFASLFAPGIAALCAEHPGLSLELVGGAGIVDLARGDADVAIRGGPIDGDDLLARKLCDCGFSLYAATRYLARRPAPKDLDDLGGHDLVGYDPSLASLPPAQWIEQRAQPGAIVLRSRELSEMVAATVSGVGLAMLPCMLGDLEATLVRLTPEVLASRKLSLVYRREAKLSAPVQAVIDFATAVIDAHADRIRGVVPRR